MFVEFKLQRGASSTMTLVEEALAPNSKLLASAKGSRARPSKDSSRMASARMPTTRSSAESSRSPIANNSDHNSRSQSPSDSSLSDLSSQGMEELERLYDDGNK